MKIKFKFSILPVLLLFVFINIGTAQQITEKIELGHTIYLNSVYLGEGRQVHIYLPPDYEQTKNRYPVLYLLDGGFHFHHATGIVQFLSNNGRMPRAIVAAIPNTNRNRDFTPIAAEERPGSGGADKFLDFLQKELIPHIDENYRTHDYRILFGHSLTAMFACYTLASRPEIFKAYIAASPYLMQDDELVLKKAKDAFDKNGAAASDLYMTIGNEPRYTESMEKFTSLLKQPAAADINWKYKVMDSEDHGSVVHKTIYDGLEFIYSGWRIPADSANDIKSIEKHYKTLSEKFGYEIKAPEFVLNRLGYQKLQADKVDEAVRIFEQNVKLYPESANVYDSLAEAYERAGRIELAAENYKTAVENGKKTNDANLNIFVTNLKRVEEKLK